MYTAQAGRRGVVVSTIDESSPTRQAFHVLHVVVAVSVIALGVDRLFHVFADWDACVAPQLAAIVPLSIHRIALVLGALEIAFGVFAAVRPRAGGAVLCLWLIAMALNITLSRHGLGVALVDLILAAVAFSLSRLATAYARVTDLPG
jgi:hypothetical protein